MLWDREMGSSYWIPLKKHTTVSKNILQALYLYFVDVIFESTYHLYLQEKRRYPNQHLKFDQSSQLVQDR